MQRGRRTPSRSVTRRTLIVGAGLILTTGCSLGGGGSDRRLTGEFEVLVIAPVNCDRYPFALNIKDGAGKVLRHVEGQTSGDRPQTPGGGTSCVRTYSAEVPKSSVYIIESERYPKMGGDLYRKTVDEAQIKDGRVPRLATLY